MPSKLSEGWGVLRPGDRVFHYYRNHESLCMKIGFYFGDLTEDTGNPEPQHDDCKACFRKLRKEAS